MPESHGEHCIQLSHNVLLDVRHVLRFLPGLAQGLWVLDGLLVERRRSTVIVIAEFRPFQKPYTQRAGISTFSDRRRWRLAEAHFP